MPNATSPTVPNKNFFIAFFSISVARDLSEAINVTATAYCLVADVRLIPTSSTPQAANILRDHVARLRTFNATTRFSNMTAKWRAGQRFCPSKIRLQNGTRTIWNLRNAGFHGRNGSDADTAKPSRLTGHGSAGSRRFDGRRSKLLRSRGP
jgi:hypothetical protein